MYWMLLRENYHFRVFLIWHQSCEGASSAHNMKRVQKNRLFLTVPEVGGKFDLMPARRFHWDFDYPCAFSHDFSSASGGRSSLVGSRHKTHSTADSS
jgi:hypothetical protein